MEKFLIIFDCDGVLVDSEGLAAEVLSSSITKMGYAISSHETQEKFLGCSLDMVMNILKTDLSLVVHDTFKEKYLKELHGRIHKNLKPIPGIRKTISKIKNIKHVESICVASNGEEETVLISLKVTNLISFFDNNIFTASDVLYGKPDPDLFLYTAQKMRFAPNRCIVIEDSIHGVKAAITAGMFVFGYVREQHDSNETNRHLISAGAKTFSKMDQLPLLIANML